MIERSLQSKRIKDKHGTLTLDLGCGDYDIVRPLKDGAVRAEGLEINFVTVNRPPEVHWRMGFITSSMPPKCPSAVSSPAKLAAIFRSSAYPAFVYRKFRHSCAYVNVHAGINKPEDLKGRRVGVPEWQMTATVWLRGFFQDDYGVQPSDVHWFTGGLESSERKEKVALALPAGDQDRKDRARSNPVGHARQRRDRCADHRPGTGTLRQGSGRGKTAVRRPSGGGS